MKNVTVSLFDLKREKINTINHYVHLVERYNKKINVISRKDIAKIFEHHIYHSLSITLKKEILKDSELILDIGSGAGLPSIPLAIYYPDKNFVSCEISENKCFVQEEMIRKMGLKNISVENIDAHEIRFTGDTLISRAFSGAETIISIAKNISQSPTSHLKKVVMLKGGETEEVLKSMPQENITEYDISSLIDDPYYQEKKIMVLSGGFKEKD